MKTSCNIWCITHFKDVFMEKLDQNIDWEIIFAVWNKESLSK